MLPFPHLYRCSSALRLASISPAAASVARRPRILSAASGFLPYPSANLHTRAAAKKAFIDPLPSPPPSSNVGDADQEWICPKCSSTNFTKNTKCLKCNEVQPNSDLTCGNSECPRCNFCLRCNCKCTRVGAHGRYCAREVRRLIRRLLGLVNYEGGPELTLFQFKRKAKRLIFRCKLDAIRKGDYFELSQEVLDRPDGMSEEEKLEKWYDEMYEKLVRTHAIDLRHK